MPLQLAIDRILDCRLLGQGECFQRSAETAEATDLPDPRDEPIVLTYPDERFFGPLVEAQSNLRPPNDELEPALPQGHQTVHQRLHRRAVRDLLCLRDEEALPQTVPCR
jgi:hypothetical protein